MTIEIPAPGVNPNGYFCSQCKTPDDQPKKIPTNTIHGHLDWLTRDPVGSERLWEHKALSFFQCQRYEKAEELPLDHLYQTCLYSHGLQLLQPELKDASLLIKNKNSAQYLEYELTYDIEAKQAHIHRLIISNGDMPATIKKIKEVDAILIDPVGKCIEKFLEVEPYRKNPELELPARPYPYGTDFPCNYCLWGKKCWEGYEDELPRLEENVYADQEASDMVRYERELAVEESDVIKKRKEVRDKIKVWLMNHKAKSGIAGEYGIALQIIPRKGYTVESTTYEKLTVKKLEPEVLERHQKVFLKKKEQEKSGELKEGI